MTHQHIGQMDMYLRMFDDLKRGEILRIKRQSTAFCLEIQTFSPFGRAIKSGNRERKGFF